MRDYHTWSLCDVHSLLHQLSVYPGHHYGVLTEQFSGSMNTVIAEHVCSFMTPNPCSYRSLDARP